MRICNVYLQRIFLVISIMMSAHYACAVDSNDEVLFLIAPDDSMATCITILGEITYENLYKAIQKSFETDKFEKELLATYELLRNRASQDVIINVGSADVPHWQSVHSALIHLLESKMDWLSNISLKYGVGDLKRAETFFREGIEEGNDAKIKEAEFLSYLILLNRDFSELWLKLSSYYFERGHINKAYRYLKLASNFPAPNWAQPRKEKINRQLELVHGFLQQASSEQTSPDSVENKFTLENFMFLPQGIKVGDDFLVLSRSNDGEVYTFLLDGVTGKNNPLFGMHRIGMASKHLLEPGLTKLVKKGDRIYIVSVLGILELDEDGRFVGLEPFERLLEFDLNAVSIAQFIWNNLRRNTGSLMQKHHQFLEVSLRHTESIVRTAAFLLLNNVEEELTDLPKERLVDFSKALYHADDDFKFFIIRVLGNQTMLKNEGIFPEETLAPIVKSLGDSYDLIPGCAGAILHDIKNLPFEILKAIVPFVSRGSFDETRKGTIWANETRKGALYALENRENLPAEILHDLAFDFLRGDIKVGDILDEQIRLSLETLHLLINKYSDRREDVREKVLKILVWQRMTPQIVQVLVQSLSDPYAQVRKTAATALDQNRYLSQDILTIIIRRLFSDEKDAEIRSWLAQILASQCELSVNIVNVLAQQFSAEDIWNRRNATYALKWQRKLSNEILDQVAPLLLDADSNVRSNAARIFSSQETALNEKYLPALVQYLWSGDSPNDAYGALRNQPGFPQTIYNSFAQKLNDPDSIVREWAAGVLEDNKQHMPLDILKALAKLAFDDENKKVALEASIALADQMSVPAEIFDIIADKLEHKDSRIRSRAIVALKNKENVSIEILRTLLKHFDQDANVRISAAYTFESYKNLPQEILDHIALLLEDEDPMMREMALKSLHNKDKLRGDMIKTVISLLADEFKDIKYYAVQVIESQSSLSKETMTVLDNLLSDPDYFYRVLAMNILGRHENVPQNILNKILLRLTDKDSSVRQAAMVTLAHQPYLSKGQINSIAQVLKDKRDYIRSDIADELKEFKQLPEEILNALVLCLSDSDVYVQISASEALAAQEKLPEDIRKKLEDFQNN